MAPVEDASDGSGVLKNTWGGCLCQNTNRKEDSYRQRINVNNARGNSIADTQPIGVGNSLV